MVILLTHEYDPFKGGVAIYCREINAAAERLHIPLCVWAPRNAIGQNVININCGSTLSPINILSMAFELIRKSRDLENANLVLASYGAHLAAMTAILVGGLKRCRISSLLHGSEIPRFERNFLWRFFSRILFKQVSVVFCNSTYTSTLFEQSSLYTLAPFSIVDARCACSTPATRQASIQRSPDDFRILTIARIHPRKGQIDIATALGFLPEEIKSRIVYVLGGKGDKDYLETVIQRCVRNGIRFEYLGEIPDEELAEKYASCDLFAMTSRTLKNSVEGFGISFIEAGWHGKPSIAYKTGGVGEAIIDGQTGVLVEESNIEALADALKKLICQPEKLKEMGMAAQTYSKTLNWETTAKVIYQALTS